MARGVWKRIMRRDIDEALHGWQFNPDPGEIQAREVRTRDSRSVLQVRIELGLLQMEIDGRPDGLRPHGFASYLDYLRYRAAGRGETPGGKSPSWTMSSEHCGEADREFVQYYHRRVAWLSLQRYDKALQDAEHTLSLMDFVHRHGPNQDYVESHERFRGLVLFHRTQAAAALALDRRRPDEAIDVIREGADRLRRHQRDWEEDHDPEETPNARLLEQHLSNNLRRRLRARTTSGRRCSATKSNEKAGAAGGRKPAADYRLQTTSLASNTGPSTHTRRRSVVPLGIRIGATQLKQAPNPHAM